MKAVYTESTKEKLEKLIYKIKEEYSFVKSPALGQTSGLSGHRKLYKAQRQYYYMVVKKLIENGAYRKLTDELPRLLYTGTGGEYLRCMLLKL